MVRNVPSSREARETLRANVARRARQLASGATPLVQSLRNKPAVLALREVATGKVRFEQDVRAALSKPMPRLGALVAAVSASEKDQASGLLIAPMVRSRR